MYTSGTIVNTTIPATGINSRVLWNCSSSSDFTSLIKPGSFFPDLLRLCAAQEALMFCTQRKINTRVMNSANMPYSRISMELSPFSRITSMPSSSSKYQPRCTVPSVFSPAINPKPEFIMKKRYPTSTARNIRSLTI